MTLRHGLLSAKNWAGIFHIEYRHHPMESNAGETHDAFQYIKFRSNRN